MKTAIIVQARLGSSRLPGKVLMDLAGRSVLSHVLERCRLVHSADVVCCAIPDRPEDDPVAAEAERCGAIVTRGSEQDVLARYFAAAKRVGAEIILRVTSDCPLIDPAVCDRVLGLRSAEAADYCCNNMPPSWPHGLDCEAFTMEALSQAFEAASQPYEREHVTPWLRTQDHMRRANLAGPGGVAASYRWTLDYPEDLDFFRAIFAKINVQSSSVPGMEQILQILDDHAELTAINANRRDPNRHPAPSH